MFKTTQQLYYFNNFPCNRIKVWTIWLNWKEITGSNTCTNSFKMFFLFISVEKIMSHSRFFTKLIFRNFLLKILYSQQCVIQVCSNCIRLSMSKELLKLQHALRAVSWKDNKQQQPNFNIYCVTCLKCLKTSDLINSSTSTVCFHSRY